MVDVLVVVLELLLVEKMVVGMVDVKVVQTVVLMVDPLVA